MKACQKQPLNKLFTYILIYNRYHYLLYLHLIGGAWASPGRYALPANWQTTAGSELYTFVRAQAFA
jgi:hypothetical protein